MDVYICYTFMNANITMQELQEQLKQKNNWSKITHTMLYPEAILSNCETSLMEQNTAEKLIIIQ